jgi:hypothetical protein
MSVKLRVSSGLEVSACRMTASGGGEAGSYLVGTVTIVRYVVPLLLAI